MSLKDLFLLDPAVIFLNHGSFGACPRPVMDIYQEWQRELGDEIVTTDHEYGAVDRTWQFVAKQRRARVLSVSHVTSPTALILPVADLLRGARERGILTVVDGAHAAGQVLLDLTALDADVYVANCHKWMCGPKGSVCLSTT